MKKKMRTKSETSFVCMSSFFFSISAQMIQKSQHNIPKSYKLELNLQLCCTLYCVFFVVFFFSSLFSHASEIEKLLVSLKLLLPMPYFVRISIFRQKKRKKIKLLSYFHGIIFQVCAAQNMFCMCNLLFILLFVHK